MNDCLRLWPLLIIVSSYSLGSRADPIPSNDAAPVMEVSAGDTAKITCPSNDDDHRFQFWQLKDNNILGPGNRINERKYKYEVLSGTLFIKAVSREEHGVYTCVCKHLVNTSTFNAKSVLLLVKADWQEHWEDDEVNFYRVAAIVVVVVVLGVAAYIIRNNMKYDQLRRFRDLTNESIDEDSRKGSYDSAAGPCKDVELRDGIDNPALDTDLRFVGESTPAFEYPRSSHYTSFK